MYPCFFKSFSIICFPILKAKITVIKTLFMFSYIAVFVLQFNALVEKQRTTAKQPINMIMKNASLEF